MSKEKKKPSTTEMVNGYNDLNLDNDTTKQYHLSNKKDKGRHFWYVVYPDSAPKDWIERLKSTGLAFCISPLHDKDTNPDGTKKKAHWHVIVSWPNTTTYSAALKLAEDILKCPRPTETNPCDWSLPISSAQG